MNRYQPLLLTCLFAMPLSALAVDTDKDGVADAVDPAPNNILVTGYQPPWLHTFNGDSSNDYFGYSVSGAGDVNNDGYDDVIVGAYQDDNSGTDSGSARVFSGANGSILYTFNGDSFGDVFGRSVSGAGDVNNDGYADVIVGAFGDSNNGSGSGSARVLSGANGSILYTFNGDSASDRFGYSVSGAGDVNNDGYDDVIVGAYQDDNNGTDSGSARVFSGVDGSILYTFNGDSADGYFGWSVSSAGDVNNDGYADVIVGAYYDDNNGSNSGSARVFSGANGSILYTFSGDSATDFFGYSVGGAGDVNNDGYDDVIIGANQDDNTGLNSGSARVFSGANGSILYTFNGDSASDYFGQSVSGTGDVNNDGYADMIVGAPGDDNNGTGSGSARVLSGANGSILYTFNGNGGSAGDSFGSSVSGAGDVNDDGYPDVIVGAYIDDSPFSDSGSAQLFSGALFLQQATDTDTDGLVDTLDTDDDADGMLDAWEFQYGFNPRVNEGLAAVDPDGDGLSNLQESVLVTNPYMVDTDLDGVADAADPSPNNILITGYTPPSLHTFNGDGAGDVFGSSVSGAGDVNNDGFDDVIVGAFLDDNSGTDSGSARVLSGANGVVLYTFNGDSAGDRFGYSVSGAGDVNNDGFDDVIVGAYLDDNSGENSGSARVLSGANGSILYTFNGDSIEDRFGYSVSSAGDVNNDGFDDVIVGAYLDDNSGENSGSARVLSGANGSILYTFNGDSAFDDFGISVSGAGDVNNDGYADVIVGAYYDDNNGKTDSGSARVFSGANGSILYTFNGESADGYFGTSVSDAGDVNNDGYADVIVGASWDNNNATDSGSARVFSGANGAILYTFSGDSQSDYFGISVSGAGDVNNDGYADVIVGAYQDDNNGSSSGSARVLSGANGSILYTFNGDSADDQFGYSVSSAGDVNADGYADVIVGARWDDNKGSSSGSARLFSGALFLQQTADTDGDGLVDTLDTDDDADGLLDVSDAFPQDTDNDGIPNSNDLDDDGDGVPDYIDASPLNPAEWLDSDGDGTGNNADSDDDNDTILDIHDRCPTGLPCTAMDDAYLDNNFGYAGRVLTSLAATSLHIEAVVRQSDGKLVLAGSQPNGASGRDAMLLRYHANGSADTAFGVNGKALPALSLAEDGFKSLAAQADGMLVAVGQMCSGVNGSNCDDTNVTVVRFNTNGAMDTSFGTGGVVSLDTAAAAYIEGLEAVSVQPDGKIVAAGYTCVNYDIGGSTCLNRDALVLRLNSNGTLDGGFGSGGVRVLAAGAQHDELFALALQPNGKIVAAGRTCASGSCDDYNSLLMRLNADGSLDSSFAVSGIGSYDTGPNAWMEQLNVVAVKPDGSIVSAGYSCANGGPGVCADKDLLVYRVQANGAMDFTHGVNGAVFVPMGNTDEEATDFALADDGSVWAGGYTASATGSDVVLVHVLANGTLDTGFSDDGKHSSWLQSHNRANTMLMQPDGKLVLAGVSHEAWATDTTDRVAMLRYSLSVDSDGDGVPDAQDAFPFDISETLDTDNDGIGNNADLDDDGDNVPDYIDVDPLNPAINTEAVLPLDGGYKGSTINDSVAPL